MLALTSTATEDAGNIDHQVRSTQGHFSGNPGRVVNYWPEMPAA